MEGQVKKVKKEHTCSWKKQLEKIKKLSSELDLRDYFVYCKHPECEEIDCVNDGGGAEDWDEDEEYCSKHKK